MRRFGSAVLPARFWAKINVSEQGCWEWTACLVHGYGMYSIMSRPYRAHRIAYEALVGPIPAGLQLDHLCRNVRCVNPAHLEPVTSQENTWRGEGVAGRHHRATACIHGHPFDADNTYVRRPGTRACKRCLRIREIERKRRLREAA